MQLMNRTILGFLAGFLLGMGDYFLLRLFSVTMFIDGNDVTLWVVLLFALSFGALGAVIAVLWEQRRDLKTQSELIRAQYDELDQMKDALVENETLAAVGRMSAGIAHEVRNPLSVIRSSAQMLADDLEGEDARAVQFIYEEVDRLDDFVTRVLDFSRGVQVETQPTSWAKLRERLDEAVTGEIEIRGDGQFDVDAELTVRLLANLVDNAQKAGDDVKVVVEAKPDAIEVADSGPGISPEHATEIFEPFFTTRAKGTGLGLAMARKLARVQGWDVVLADGGLGPDGRGARFRFQPHQLEETT